ncbi:metal-dependent hydrolase [Leptospira wolffii]|uniref:metal-dependent hydrolase n=1 Tax=Leptospira wolffii TaxID=409998 RepID=UPI00034A311C|nr:metal-dependent hydrolase [Leptospira wolffii]TGK61680.1 metal-dependent hydrolase [Leptospira wolffii]TGK70224.1 metal-dependent hydrolase [Leptospira wolffii]TGK77147.1 metal-dependent hydrolase [Leptospira wolffii]TGL31001.1 metal-dependent hydrolase [Leptospira wolffii]
MPTLFSHPAVPFSLFAVFGRKRIPISLLLFGILFSVLPDFDVIAFKLGIPYESDWGHRGFTHSILFGALLSLFAVLAKRFFQAPGLAIFLFLFVSILSHGLLDAMTTGGLGVGFWIPWDSERIFFAHRPIRVSPIGLKNFLTERGWVVLRSELLWIWLPAAGIIFLSILVRWISRKRKV